MDEVDPSHADSCPCYVKAGRGSREPWKNPAQSTREDDAPAVCPWRRTPRDGYGNVWREGYSATGGDCVVGHREYYLPCRQLCFSPSRVD